MTNKDTTIGSRKDGRVQSIPIEKVLPHPDNPNRMSRQNLSKLTEHIKRTGNYEPIIVRPHPVRDGWFEIINGHHRCEALKNAGVTEANCIVWNVDDKEALILLNTLNRLAGSDDLHKKSELIRKLSLAFSSKDLSRMLPESRSQIEKLKNLNISLPAIKTVQKAFANPMVFFLTDRQLELAETAIGLADDPNGLETKAARRARALAKMAEAFLGNSN